MTKFLLTYTASRAAAEPMPNTDTASAQAAMDAWTAWGKRCGAHLVDFGAQLGGAQTVSSAGVSPGTGNITGYSLLEADSMDAAVALLDGHPYFADPGCAIDVHESLPM